MDFITKKMRHWMKSSPICRLPTVFTDIESWKLFFRRVKRQEILPMHLKYLALKVKREMAMAEAVFVLCAVMSVICTGALMAGYRKSRNRLLLWSAFCFLLLALNNIFLCFDLIIFPD